MADIVVFVCWQMLCRPVHGRMLVLFGRLLLTNGVLLFVGRCYTDRRIKDVRMTDVRVGIVGSGRVALGTGFAGQVADISAGIVASVWYGRDVNRC